jgi:hypothetical protein
LCFLFYYNTSLDGRVGLYKSDRPPNNPQSDRISTTSTHTKAIAYSSASRYNRLHRKKPQGDRTTTPTTKTQTAAQKTVLLKLSNKRRNGLNKN